MDLTNEKNYINKLFEQKEKLIEAKKMLNESYGIDSYIKDDITLAVKDCNKSKLSQAKLKQELTETFNLDNDTVSIVFE